MEKKIDLIKVWKQIVKDECGIQETNDGYMCYVGDTPLKLQTYHSRGLRHHKNNQGFGGQLVYDKLDKDLSFVEYRELLKLTIERVMETSNNKLIEKFPDCAVKAENEIGRTFTLTKGEEKLFEESGSKKIMFETGNGIGIGVSYYNTDSKAWVDITDYSKW